MSFIGPKITFKSKWFNLSFKRERSIGAQLFIIKMIDDIGIGLVYSIAIVGETI